VALLIGGTLALIFLDLPWSAVVIALLVGVEFFEFRIWRWTVRQRPAGGNDALVGRRGTMIAPGRVRIDGRSYAAVGKAEPGDEVVVEATEGMALVVRPAD
jgi:membrane protein implicated in regulation of membrane protease activity